PVAAALPAGHQHARAWARALPQIWPAGSRPRHPAVGRAAASHGRDRALCPIPGQRALSNQSLMDQLTHLIEVWTSYAQGLTRSIGALASVCASTCIVQSRASRFG